jgi:hypothetical protein
MKQSDDGYAPSYNLQVSTDSIVAQAVSQRPEDSSELLPALSRIEENTGKSPAQIAADGSYTTRENIMAMEEKETDFYGSFEGRSKKRMADGEFHRDKFIYDHETEVYVCPQGKVLPYRRKDRGVGKKNCKALRLPILPLEAEVLSQGGKPLCRTYRRSSCRSRLP